MDEIFAPYPARLTVSQLREILGVPRTTMYRWLNDESIPAKKVGGTWLIWRDEVKDALKAGRNLPPTAPPETPEQE